MRKTIEKILDVMANLGLALRDTRREKVTNDQRQWGPEVEGFVLSIHLVEPMPTLSVALKNTTPVERRAVLPPWLLYYKVSINALPTPFGRQVLSGAQNLPPTEVVFPPGQPVITEIPIATLYDMRAPGEYKVSVSCPVPGSQAILTSNEISVIVDKTS
jgi:hypothetical protein